jgi:8-oxo-dGTP pyrophosphatase MutT (NUDIX family)
VAGAAERADAASDVVHAAGAVLVNGSRTAIVHRPRYDDWTLPKGKRQRGEDDRATALREVLEETGHTGEIERDLGTVTYQVVRDGAMLPKIVRYFLMRSTGGSFRPGGEVDELRWAERAEAMNLVSYDRDREVLSRWP